MTSEARESKPAPAVWRHRWRLHVALACAAALLLGAAEDTPQQSFDEKLARVDYGRLDDPDNDVRVRLDSTAVDLRNRGDGAEVTYVRHGETCRVRGKHVVYAGYQNGYVARTTNALARSPSWELFAQGLIGAWVSSIAVHPTDPDVVVCGGVDLHRSASAGAHWRRASRWDEPIGHEK